MSVIPWPAGLRSAPRGWRLVVLAAFVASIGTGLYITSAAVYFVRVVGLSATQVGLGLSAAALAGLGAGLVAGRLADRFGARDVAIAGGLGTVPLLVAMTQIRSFWAFALVAALLGLAFFSADVARGALIAQVAGAGNEAQLASYDRSGFNAGFSIGLLCAGAAISAGTRSAYQAVFVTNAIAQVGAVMVLARLPRSPINQHTSHAAKKSVRDVPYLLVGQIAGLTRLGDVILTVGLPLWIVTHTRAPRGLAAWLLAVNTVLVITLQARATRRAGTVEGASQLQRQAFLVLAAACVVAIPASHLNAGLAAIVLCAVVVLLTAAELWGEGAAFVLRYALAPADAQGSYGGVFALGQAVPGVAGPVLITTLAVTVGGPGWLGLAGLFLVSAVVCRTPVRWAQRDRELPEGAPTTSESGAESASEPEGEVVTVPTDGPGKGSSRL